MLCLYLNLIVQYSHRPIVSCVLQTETGYRLEIVTVRKLEFEADAFAFGDKLIAKWFPEKTDADKKGVLIVVTTGKDGAITGGPSFTQVSRTSRQWRGN